MKHLIALAFILSNPVHASDLNRVSYFKDSNRNRVMVYVAASDSTAATVEQELSSTMHTMGQITLVFVYPHGSKDNVPFGLTSVANYMTAVNVMYSEPARGWRYSFQKNTLGRVTFTDCGADPQSTVCHAENN